MGLDMYLEGDVYIPENWKEPEKNLMEDGFIVKSYKVKLGYWRKHPNLHGYIVENFADGEDNCQPISLDRERIEQIIKAINNDELPETQGFFFGSSPESGEEKKAQQAEDTKVFAEALAWLEKKGGGDRETWRSITYQASW